MGFSGRSAILNRKRRRLSVLVSAFVLAAIFVRQAGTSFLAAAQVRTKVNPKDGLTYVWIPPGTFQMGCSVDDSECTDFEKPAHSVTVSKGFWIGQRLVTQAAYQKVVGINPSHFKGDQLPVEQIAWDDAQAYCEHIGMRLPTEAEWEYAARGGSPDARYAPVDRIAWYSENSDGTTHEVAQKQPNGYGLYDMLGNVWEWVADRYGPYAAAGAADPKGPRTGWFRVLRGGSWVNDASDVRASSRGSFEPGIHDGYDDFYNFVGVRCAGE